MSRLFAIDDALDSDAWYTPAWIFDGLGIVFDLDVAHPAERLPWIPANEVYTVADDGLTHPWHGVVWCNPPYSDPRPWCLRWAEHADGLILTRSDLSTIGTFAAFAAASSVYVPPRRLQFVDGSGAARGRQSEASFSSVLLGRGDTANAGIARLAASHGGTARQLRSAA